MIKLQKINKYFSEHHVLKEIDLSVKKGEVVVILGPSGSGKSTLLRSINFLEHPSSGIIEIGGLKVNVENVKKKERSFILFLLMMKTGQRITTLCLPGVFQARLTELCLL